MGLIGRFRAWRQRRALNSGNPAALAPGDGAQLLLPGSTSNLFDADRPRRLGDSDPLRRSAWIRTFEQQLSRIPVTDSFVFSLEGPWGAGKTSVLDTIEADLTAEGLVVLRFNPWLFAGATDLVGAFFRELAAQLRQRQERFKQLADVFGGLASILGMIGTAAGVPQFAIFKDLLKGSSDALGYAATLQSVPSLLEEKRRFEAILAKSELRLIVLVDDLERLTARESLEVLRAVRVIADLPGIIYVLAFDREQLVRGLEAAGENAAFLDKIIQIPMRLPTAPPDALQALLSQKLDAVIQQLECAELDSVRWSEIAFKVVLPAVKTPRDVARLANAVAVALAHVGKRVALEDVITLETLRLFEPTFFTALRGQRTYLTAGEDTQVEIVRSMARHDRNRANKLPIAKDATEAREKLLTLAHDRTICTNALTVLFPALNEIDGQGSGGGFELRRSRRERRVAVTEVFDLYMEAEPRSEILDLAFVAAIVDARDVALRDMFATLSVAQLGYLFNTLGDHAARLIIRSDLRDFVRDLLGQARRIPISEPAFFVDRPEMAPARFVYRLLESMKDEKGRGTFIASLIKDLPAELAGTMADILLRIEKDATGHLDLTSNDFEPVYDELRMLIRSLNADAIVAEREHSWLLRWAYQPERSAHLEALRRLLENAEVFAAFVHSALRRTQYGSGHLVIEYRSEPFEGIFASEDDLRRRLMQVANSGRLSADEAAAVHAALDSGARLVASPQGEPPNPE